MTDDNVIQFPASKAPDEVGADEPEYLVLARENARRQEEIGVDFPQIGVVMARLELLTEYVFELLNSRWPDVDLAEEFELRFQKVISTTIDAAEKEKGRQRSQLLRPDGRLVLPDGSPTQPSGSPA